MPKARDPLQFAYVRIKMQGDEQFKPNVFKVFYVDDHKIRVRAIKLVAGKEIEGINTWIPWMAIDVMEEVEVGKAIRDNNLEQEELVRHKEKCMMSSR